MADEKSTSEPEESYSTNAGFEATDTYPVLTLPNEIVAEIFLHCTSVYPICSPLSTYSSPTLLTQICRQWRTVALAIPGLWRAISLYRVKRHELDVLNAWLPRSGSLPLSIDMDDKWTSDDIVREVLGALVPHCGRWEHIKLRLSCSHLSIIDAQMPLISHFDVAFRSATTAPRVSPAPATFTDTPFLRTAILNNTAAACIPLPWPQLTSLTLTAIYPTQCGPILRQTTQLVHCTLALCLEAPPPPPDTTLPHLQSLVLMLWEAGGDEPTSLGYLQSFIVPALRKLQVPENFLGTRPVYSLGQFIAKSGCNLQQLCLTGFPRFRFAPEKNYTKAFPYISNITFVRESEEYDSDED
ncbi:hypothetical protein C8R43DRAFT_227261 [Mycena crocata]|nr:hypothetical protein C8R43DRAFT_227261 [Mycena crocata]